MAIETLIKGHRVIVSDEDGYLLSAHKWHVSKSKNTYYARTFIDGKVVGLHNLIIHPHQGLIVDHINHNGLDNRRCNLRVCTRQENARNALKPLINGTSSIYKGVSKCPGGWSAHIRVEKRTLHLGTFRTEARAAEVYNEAAIKYFGEFACLNIL